MIFNNPIFKSWYTDTVDIYRIKTVTENGVSRQERRKVNGSPVPCRIYKPENKGPLMTNTAARGQSSEEMACDLDMDIQEGDELMLVRGGNLGRGGKPERYLAGAPMDYLDPVGGALTGLGHKEVGLLRDNIIGR